MEGWKKRLFPGRCFSITEAGGHVRGTHSFILKESIMIVDQWPPHNIGDQFSYPLIETFCTCSYISALRTLAPCKQKSLNSSTPPPPHPRMPSVLPGPGAVRVKHPLGIKRNQIKMKKLWIKSWRSGWPYIWRSGPGQLTHYWTQTAENVESPTGKSQVAFGPEVQVFEHAIDSVRGLE